jgi:hypothetical protein
MCKKEPAGYMVVPADLAARNIDELIKLIKLLLDGNVHSYTFRGRCRFQVKRRAKRLAKNLTTGPPQTHLLRAHERTEGDLYGQASALRDMGNVLEQDVGALHGKVARLLQTEVCVPCAGNGHTVLCSRLT